MKRELRRVIKITNDLFGVLSYLLRQIKPLARRVRSITRNGKRWRGNFDDVSLRVRKYGEAEDERRNPSNEREFRSPCIELDETESCCGLFV